MKRLKLFPKIFIYTLFLMLMIALLASAMFYLLAPIMASDNLLTPGSAGAIPGIASTSIPRNEEITKSVLGSLPYTMGICVVISLISAFLFSRAITKPIKHIVDTTVSMTSLKKDVKCSVQSTDEIGQLSESINELYSKLLQTIENLKYEKEQVAEAEKLKIDFLRTASHELKTPVTALNAILDNMVMGIGKYKDYDTYLPLCKERSEQIAKMITEILDTSKLGTTVDPEPPTTFDTITLLSSLCEQYQLIAQANGMEFNIALLDCFPVCLPKKMFSKAISNILANAVAYTVPGGKISVYIDNRNLMIENECLPIPTEHLKKIFEPFYRPDYARNKRDGGNGLGLYIVACILNYLDLPYSFCPMKEPNGMRFTISLQSF